MISRGFTVIELIITIAVMGILMVLAVVNVNASQEKARDDERRADTAAIASALESYYLTGTDGSTQFGRYPDTTITASQTALQAALRDAALTSFLAPTTDTVTSSFIPATNGGQTTATVTPQPTVSQYVYQPLDVDGALCTSPATECRKFNLFYRLEGDDSVNRVMSKNQ